MSQSADDPSKLPTTAGQAEPVPGTPNTFYDLVMFCGLGAFVSSFTFVLALHFSLPPTDGAYGGAIFGPAVGPIMLIGAALGTVIALPFSYGFLRRAPLKDAVVLVYGPVLITIGLITPIQIILAIPAAFIVMAIAMANCMWQFQSLDAESTGSAPTHPPKELASPNSSKRVILVFLVLILAGYIIAAAIPNRDVQLMRAAEDGDLEGVRRALKDGGDPNYEGGWSRSALSFAIDGEHEDVVRDLLEAGADVNQRLYNNMTPLMLAAESGQENIVKLLIRFGADLRLTDNDGRTAEDMAIAEGHLGLAKRLVPTTK